MKEADREANRVIEETGLLVTETVERIQQKHYELSIENFKLQFKAKENEYSTITKLFDYHEAVERKNLRPGSYRGYIVTRKHLLDFVRIKFHLSDYSIEAIDKAFVYEFFAYLQGYRREGTVRCAVNGALKHIARFKRIMNLAIQNEWITNNPVCLLKVHKEYVEKGYLTEEEIRRLKAVTLPPHLGIARDIFMFSVYTGMAYVDILMLTNKNITLGIDGSHWLNYHRQKTSQRVAVPLLEPAEELIARYATYHGEKAKQPIFPVPCNQAINRYLKTIAKAGSVLLSGVVIGLIEFLIGAGWAVAVGFIAGAVIAELLARAGHYKSFWLNTIGYSVYMTFFALGTYLPMVIMTGYVDDMSTSNGVSAEYLTELHSFMNGTMVVIIAVVTFVAGIVGALIAKGVFKKHFQKAGIV